MNIKIKVLVGVLTVLMIQAAWAADTHYEMRVDGLACPFCVFGIEKKLKEIDGVSEIKVDLDKGLVAVNVAEGKQLTKEQMIKLFTDAGFTFRSMTKTDL